MRGGPCSGRDRIVENAPAVEEGVDECLWVAREEPLGQVGRLGEEQQVIGTERGVGSHELPHVQHRDDVEGREVADRLGVLEGEALGDEAAAVVAGYGEALEGQAAHERHHVAGHRALAEVRDGARGAGAVAAQVGADHGEVVAQSLRDRVPADVGLWEAVQKQQRGARALDDVMEVDGAHDVGRGAPARETGGVSVRSMTDRGIERITAPDGANFDGYVISPDGGRGPGILLLQEIFGVGGYLRAVAERLAELGYVVVMPDVFWRIEPGLALDHDEAGLQAAFGYMGRYAEIWEQGMADLDAAYDHLASMPAVGGGVGLMGFCLGGRLA